MGVMRTNTAAIRVGRLLEVRVELGYRTAADVDRLFDTIDRELMKLPPTQKIVTVADWRRISVMSPDAAGRLGKRIALLNPRTQKSAAVALAATEAPVAVLQFMRLLREASFADRRMFDDTEQLVMWLEEILTPAETERLREFLCG
jgi:hypothetical protein